MITMYTAIQEHEQRVATSLAAYDRARKAAAKPATKVARRRHLPSLRVAHAN